MSFNFKSIIQVPAQVTQIKNSSQEGAAVSTDNGDTLVLSDPTGTPIPQVAGDTTITNPTLNADALTKNQPTQTALGISSKSAADNKTPNNEDVVLYDRVTQSAVYKVNGKDVHEGKMVYSAFNPYTLINYRGTPLQGTAAGIKYGEYNKLDFNPDVLSNPTVQKIIERTNANGGLGYRYAYSDFALCKYLGRIPNNYLITLRRFPFPIEDDIITPIQIGKGGQKLVKPSPDIARAVTWMSEETGNKLDELISFGYGYNWKEVKAAVQELNSQTKDRRGKFGEMMDGNPFLRSLNAAANGVGANERIAKETQSSDFDPVTSTYPNYVFGPYNSIQKMRVRDEGGLNFDKDIELKFQYQLKSLHGANPKVMFLDLMGQILALTYNTAPFWGGAVRYIGGGPGTIGKPLGSAEMIRNGDYKGFLTSVMNDIGKMASTLVGDIKQNGLAGNKLVNNLLGGSLLNLFNTPQGGQIANALLTGDSTGQWHITIGNPLNPILVMGNLTCEDTKINFKGPLGIQDFPEELEVIIKLKPARPRDKAEIESMFNAGKGRFYIQPYGAKDINSTQEVDSYGHVRGGGNWGTGGLKLTPNQKDQLGKFANG